MPLVWAALDCPGGWSAGIAGRPMVLGTMTARVLGAARGGRAARRRRLAARSEGRKHHSGTAPCARPDGDAARPGRGHLDRRRPHHHPTPGPPMSPMPDSQSPTDTAGDDRPTSPSSPGRAAASAPPPHGCWRRTASGSSARPAALERVEALAAEIGGVAVACDVTARRRRGRPGGGRRRPRARARQQRRRRAGPRAGRAGRRRAVAADVRHQRPRHAAGDQGAAARARRGRRRGVVVNVGSIAGFLAYEGGGGYTVAKHGVHVMTETLRLELVDQPVRITLVAPGMVRTEEFSLTRFGGDRERADAVYAGVPEPARRRGRRRRHRLDGDPAGPRQHRPARRQAPRPGRAAQGAPRAHLTRPEPRASCPPTGCGFTTRVRPPRRADVADPQEVDVVRAAAAAAPTRRRRRGRPRRYAG